MANSIGGRSLGKGDKGQKIVTSAKTHSAILLVYGRI